MKLLFGISFSLLMALVGYKKKAVSKDGAVAGFFVGICSCVFGGYRGASVLFFFFFSSSLLTRFKGKNKKQIEHGHKKGGQRNWVQVFSNGVAGSIFALFFALTSSGTILNVNEPPIDLYDNFWATFYIIGYISHYACCNGDTWASELGVVMGAVQPLLLLGIKDGKVLLLKRVPRGTNGAVSLFGCLASIAGGLLVGIAFELANILLNGFSLSQLCLSLFIGASAGFIGSTIDSLLGGLLQSSYHDKESGKVVEVIPPNTKVVHITGFPILDNHQVNLLSSLISTVLIPSLYVAYYLNK